MQKAFKHFFALQEARKLKLFSAHTVNSLPRFQLMHIELAFFSEGVEAINKGGGRSFESGKPKRFFFQVLSFAIDEHA